MEAEYHIPKFYSKYISISLVSPSVCEFKSKEQIGIIDEVLQIVCDFENFISILPEDYEKKHVIVNLTELITGFGMVKDFHGEERDFGVDDFPDVANDAVKGFKALDKLLKEIVCLEKPQKRHCITKILLFCGTHNKNHHWTSKMSVDHCNEFLAKFLACMGYENLQSCLCDEEYFPTIFKYILKVMRPALVKDQWLRNPSICYIFSWLLHNVKHPHLVDYLSDIFPPPFMFISHFSVPYQELGLKCLYHILDNIPPTAIKMDGREGAIIHALSPLLYSTELQIIEHYYPCVLKLPSTVTLKNSTEFWTQFDDIFTHLIRRTDMEEYSKLHEIYLSHILSFVNHYPPFKHLKAILSLLQTNLSPRASCNVQCKAVTLKILKAVIKSCWPRMERYCFDIMKMIIISIYTTSEKKEELSTLEIEELLQLSEECLLLLKFSCEDIFKSLARDYVKNEDLPGVKILQNVLATCNRVIA